MSVFLVHTFSSLRTFIFEYFSEYCDWITKVYDLADLFCASVGPFRAPVCPFRGLAGFGPAVEVALVQLEEPVLSSS